MKTFEVEQKFKVKTPAVVRRKIKKLGGKLVKKGQEKNELWDCKGMIRRQASVLRVREVKGKGLLTFKGPKLKSRFKRRLEIEMPVDPKRIRIVLQSMDFKITARYEKYREEYKLGKAHVTIDRLSRLGWFSEIEAPAASIMKIAGKLGFTKKDREERSYLEMIYGNRSRWAGK